MIIKNLVKVGDAVAVSSNCTLDGRVYLIKALTEQDGNYFIIPNLKNPTYYFCLPKDDDKWYYVSFHNINNYHEVELSFFSKIDINLIDEVDETPLDEQLIYYKSIENYEKCAEILKKINEK